MSEAPNAVAAQLPAYAALLGLRRVGPLVLMPFSPILIGAPGRLHGGAVAGLMEIAANVAAREAVDTNAVVKPVNVTVDYLREGALEDTWAEVFLIRVGRRVANVRVEAWQTDRARLIAGARMNMLIVRPDGDSGQLA